MWIVLWNPVLKFFFFCIKYLCVPWTVHGTHWNSKKMLFSSCTGPIVHVLKKKKNAKTQTLLLIINIQTGTRDSLVDYLKKISFSLRLSQSVCVCDKIDSYVSHQKKKKKKIVMYRRNYYIKMLTIWQRFL